jgi:hydroxymethylpyrimidine/phosphomethylpyrimidine kinase
MGCHPLSVITALTVQDTAGVEGVLPIDADWVSDQARCLLERHAGSMRSRSACLGSVRTSRHRRDRVRLSRCAADPSIPCSRPAAATRLATGRNDARAARTLLPQTTIVTPNSLEVRRLAEADDDEELSIEACAMRLIEAGCEYVLVTGTHENTPQVINTLYAKSGVVRADTWPAAARAPTTARLHARRPPSPPCWPMVLTSTDAVREAQDYTWHTLQKGVVAPAWASIFRQVVSWARERSRRVGRSRRGGAFRRCARRTH